MVQISKHQFDIRQLFGIVMFLNYIVYFFIFDYSSDHVLISIILRAIASGLCVPLMFKGFARGSYIDVYKNIYWWLTITYCLPFFFTLMTLLNHLSAVWLMNTVSAAFLLILVARLRVFFISMFVGSATAIAVYKYLFKYSIIVNLGTVSIYDILATYFAVIVIGSIFAHNKEAADDYRELISANIKQINSILEQKVAERTTDLETALKIKTDILNNVSHEVRTPISGITSISQGMVDDWDRLDNNKRKQYAIQVAECGRRLFSLMSNLLDLSKISAGKMVMDMQPANIKELVDEMIHECEMLYLNSSEITIDFRVIGNPRLKTVADKDRLVQVLRNLFANAIKFTKRKNPKSVLHAMISERDGNILFELIDEGPGIPAGELESIFEPFVQSTRTNTGASGTGLGLSISKEIIEAHGGKIWAENNPEVGAKFSFIIPIVGVCDNSQSSEISQTTQTKHDLTIMIVDDEHSCHGSLDLLLSYLDAKILNYYSGIDALEYLKSHPHDVDLILLDLMMPDMHGMEVLRTIRATPALAHLKVIIQSGSYDPEDMRMALELGSIGYVSKPYNKDNLMKCIEKAFSNT